MHSKCKSKAVGQFMTMRVRDARTDGHVAGRGAVAHVSSSLLSIALRLAMHSESV